ncbi:MAG: glycosyltransferase family 10 domain-containing protein [Planctomycetota bacterium]|jgi:hypothetical protein
MKKKIKINFTDFWHSNTPEAIRTNPIFMILSKKFELQLSENPDFLIYSCFGRNFLKYKCVRIFYVGENVRPNFDECDYAFSFDYPVTERNYRLPLYKLYGEFEELKREKKISEIMREKSKFCNFVYSKKRAKTRIDFFHKLQKYKKVDSGGKLLNNIGYLVDDKVAFLRQYKFTMAFENSCYPGYTTEKILHAFVADSIPIYWGNPWISRDFNPKSFINCHDYNSFDEVIERVIEIDNNDDLYIQYLKESPFNGNRENEHVNEANILRRFERIFSNNDIKLVAKKTDIIKFYTHPAYIISKCRQIYDWLLTRHSN